MDFSKLSSIAIAELLLILFIVLLQTGIGIWALIKIRRLRNIIPNTSFLRIEKYSIPIEVLINCIPKDLLKNLSYYKEPDPVAKGDIEDADIFDGDDFIEDSHQLYEENILPYDEFEEEAEYTTTSEVSLIIPSKSSVIFDSILESINVYLLRNKGATTDFNLIKDITERNLDSEEDSVSQTTTVPLYLGLMGTILGIIFGLWNLYIISDNGDELQIKDFLGGVAVAMFASLYGLLWTVVNSNFILKAGIRLIDKGKNNFYTFIQTELLPILNQSVSSSVYQLHTNLVKFNDDFTLNIDRLSKLMGKNYESLIAQDRILQHLENIDITEFAKANIKILTELKSTTKDLEKFNKYMYSLNSTVDSTSKLSDSFSLLLNKVNYFEGIANKLDSRIEESNRLIDFLSDHYRELGDRSELINNSVKTVDDVLTKALVELREHTKAKISSIKEITLKEEDMMAKTFAENRSHFSKLSLLSDMNKSIDEFKMSSKEQINILNTQIKLLKEGLDETNTVLKKINNDSILKKTQNMAISLKKFFLAKKGDEKK